MDKTKNKTWLDILLNYFMFFTAYLVVSKGLVLILLLLGKNDHYNAGILLFGSACSILLIAGFVWCYKRLELKKYIGNYEPTHQKKWIAFIGSLLGLIIVSYLLTLFVTPAGGTGLLQSSQTMSPYVLGYYFFRTVLLVPIYEEILFRGVLLGAEKWLILKITQQKQLQILFLVVLVTVNSIIFSSLHNPTNVISFVLYVIFGWISSSLYLYTKALKLSIYLHQINNLLAVLSFF